MSRDRAVETVRGALAKVRMERLRGIANGNLPDDTVPSCLEDARAALDALEAAGLAVVPVEPDESMLRAGSRNVDHSIRYSSTREVYRAMLAASRPEGGGDG